MSDPAGFVYGDTATSGTNHRNHVMRLADFHPRPDEADVYAFLFDQLGVTYRPVGADALLRRNLLIWGLGGVIAPFIGIKLIDMALAVLGLA